MYKYSFVFSKGETEKIISAWRWAAISLCKKNQESSWWYNGGYTFYFADEKDYMFFCLRWA